MKLDNVIKGVSAGSTAKIWIDLKIVKKYRKYVMKPVFNPIVTFEGRGVFLPTGTLE